MQGGKKNDARKRQLQTTTEMQDARIVVMHEKP